MEERTYPEGARLEDLVLDPEEEIAAQRCKQDPEALCHGCGDCEREDPPTWRCCECGQAFPASYKPADYRQAPGSPVDEPCCYRCTLGTVKDRLRAHFGDAARMWQAVHAMVTALGLAKGRPVSIAEATMAVARAYCALHLDADEEEACGALTDWQEQDS